MGRHIDTICLTVVAARRLVVCNINLVEKDHVRHSDVFLPRHIDLDVSSRSAKSEDERLEAFKRLCVVAMSDETEVTLRFYEIIPVLSSGIDYPGLLLPNNKDILLVLSQTRDEP